MSATASAVPPPVPLLAEGVTIDPPLRAGDPWIVARYGVPRARIGEDTARLLRALDGQRSLDEAGRQAGADVDARALDALLHALERAEIVARPAPAREGGTETTTRRAGVRRVRRMNVRPRTPSPSPARSRTRAGASAVRRARARTGRVEFRAPLTVRIRLVRPGPLAALLARPLRVPAVWRALLGGAALLVVLGIIGVLRDGGETLARAFLEPLPLGALVLALLGGLLLTLAHEMAHAVALSRAGGTPSHLGVMLLAGIPAFFCDVTDGWRLGSRRARIGVALAGPALNLTVAAAAFLAALGAGEGTVSAALTLLAATSLLSAILNLLPVLPFDGYLALMAATDTPYLRERAMASAANAIAGRAGPVDGTARPPLRASSPVAHGAVVLFGAACAIAPVLVPVYAAARLSPALAGAGATGAALQLLLAALLLILVLRGGGRLLRALRQRRAGSARLALVSAAGVLVLALLAAVPVPVRETLGVARTAGGLVLVADRATALQAVKSGQRLDLATAGLLGGRPRGTTTISTRGAVTTAEVPLDALAPFHGEDTRIPAVVLPVTLTPEPAPAAVRDAARAHIHRDAEPALIAAARLFVLTPLRTLLSGGGHA